MKHPKEILFTDVRPLTSLPAVDHYAGSEKMLLKALHLQQELAIDNQAVFDITCDCEDGAPAGAEQDHATMVAKLINSQENDFGRVGARIHSLGHVHWLHDLEILIRFAGRKIAFITLPKACSAADVGILVAALENLERQYRVELPIPLHILIETHGALEDVKSIVRIDRVETIDFGLMDFVSGHYGAIPVAAMSSPGQFEYPLVVRAKTEIVAAAFAHGVVPVHNVTTEINNLTAIRADADRARREFGFLRMWSIHPNQINPILEAMRPDYSEVEEACKILLAAQKNSWGPIQHNGKLHDRASYRYFWQQVERAHKTGIPLDQAVRDKFFSNI